MSARTIKQLSSTTDTGAKRTAQYPSAMPFPARPLVIALAIAALTVSGCSDDDDNDMGPASGDSGPAMGSFAVAMNDGQDAGSVTFMSPDLATDVSTLSTGANQGVIFGADGTLYQNSDAAGSEGIRAFNDATGRADMDSFGNSDRMIGMSPGKGLATVGDLGLLASCDITDSTADLKLYSTSAGEVAIPVATVDLPAPCWDSTYDADNDRLYLAMVDGTLGIVDDVSDKGLLMPAQGETTVSLDAEAIDRLVRVIDANGVQTSVNFHGVSVENGLVLVSDVGLAESPTDGALFVFSDDGSLDGDVSVEGIAGPATMLGNPVDTLLVNGDAIVAEKSNDAILVFRNVASLSGDVSPNYRREFIKPESLAEIPDTLQITDTSDIGSDDSVSRLLISQNPGVAQQDGANVDNTNVGRILILESPAADGVSDDGLSVMAGMIMGDPGQQTFRTLENIQLDSEGNGYAVYDSTDGTSISDRGLLAIAGLSMREGTMVDTNGRDRLIGGVSAGLTSPKGVEVVGSQSALIVSDIGGNTAPASLVVLSANAGDNTMPLFTVMDTGSAAIWDTDYDPANDRLYAAGTAGDILVYDDFFAMGASAMPTRSIRVAAEGVVSNMHGIAHDATTDTLIVTDVGDAASASDGALYVIENASTAFGQVTPKAAVSGPLSLFGNPVDLAFDGSDVYIAEKSNDALLIYRDVMDLQGAMDRAADESIAVIKPESVVLAR